HILAGQVLQRHVCLYHCCVYIKQATTTYSIGPLRQVLDLRGSGVLRSTTVDDYGRGTENQKAKNKQSKDESWKLGMSWKQPSVEAEIKNLSERPMEYVVVACMM
ncbi:MAG: hypothetical protein ACKPKO_50025, partial [Candidatus Fonsibacter sp.]